MIDRFSFLNSMHISLISELYEQYIYNPDKIEPSWRAFFQGYDFCNHTYKSKDILHNNKNNINVINPELNNIIPDLIKKELNIISLIEGYIKYGHLISTVNPILDINNNIKEILNIENFGLDKEDLEKEFNCKILSKQNQKNKLKDIILNLKNLFCGNISYEYSHIFNKDEINWINKWIINNENNTQLYDKKYKKHILNRLHRANSFEKFMHKKYVGIKRFSIQGNESIIVGLYEMINHLSTHVEDVIIGMAHRGRLNVLANILEKDYKYIFSEFEGNPFDDENISGDVKYHMGFTKKISFKNNKKININLLPNPSHLETVNPIVLGITRAKLEKYYNYDKSKICSIIMHGDAAISGQGIVYETAQMSSLRGYNVGGTIHIIINNQIGFTTDIEDSKSSLYCTDIGKITLSPIVHVNADDIYSVIKSFKFAAEYKAKFNKDVYIDVIGYRKYGHNEGDEPRFTQPKLYDIISKHNDVLNIYLNSLYKENVINNKEFKYLDDILQNELENSYSLSKSITKSTISRFMPEDTFYQNGQIDIFEEVNTRYDYFKIKNIAEQITNSSIFNDKKVIKKILNIFDYRKKLLKNNKIDWALGELICYATLLEEGYNIRISGEDVERGTFSHRHATIRTEDNSKLILLDNIKDKKGIFNIYNSPLSEYGVLGFDYGYSMTMPNSLNIWEAQFGDFANGAQIIIDQYISSAEDKWKIQNGIVLLLPHGYEGQGAEHSSARLERFLQLCAKNNMIIANLTTPANFFHILRRQIKAKFRKPLIIMSPKSLLRHPEVLSNLDELSEGKFREIIDENDHNIIKSEVDNIILCTGKIYYDLILEREKKKNYNYSIIRIEQLYPLNIGELNKILLLYVNKNKKIFWVQEEPKNMGAWTYIFQNLYKLYEINSICPPSSASPSTGSYKTWNIIKQNLIKKVFNNL